MQRSTAKLLVIVCLMAPSLGNAEVKSMSLETFKNIENQRFWEVAVSCVENAAEKVIKRIVGEGNPWCAVENNELCDSSKFVLARNICESPSTVIAAREPTKALTSAAANSGAADVAETLNNTEQFVTTAILSDAGSVDSAKRTQLLREQVQIEEQRIQIEQRRLELVAAELALKKQLEN